MGACYAQTPTNPQATSGFAAASTPAQDMARYFVCSEQKMRIRGSNSAPQCAAATSAPYGPCMKLEPRIWYPQNRRTQIRFTLLIAAGWGAIAIGSLLFGFPQSWADAIWPVGAAILSLAYSVMAWGWARNRVEADQRELRVIRGLRTLTVPWNTVVDVRNDTKPPWAAHMVAELNNGEAVDVPLPADHTELLEFWAAVHRDQ